MEGLKLLIDDHGCTHAHRVDAVDPDAMWTEQLGVSPHEADHTVLGGTVSGTAAAPVVHAAEARRRAGDDDGAAFSLIDHGLLHHTEGVVDARHHDPNCIGPPL